MYLYKVFLFFSFQAENKKQNLYPVYKNDAESDPGNYRPISLLSLFSKFLAQDNDFPAYWLVP